MKRIFARLTTNLLDRGASNSKSSLQPSDNPACRHWSLDNGILDLPDDCFGVIVECLGGDQEAFRALCSCSPETMLKLMRTVDRKVLVTSELLLGQLEWLCNRRRVEVGYLPSWFRLEIRGCRSSDLQRLQPALKHVDTIRVTNREVWTGVGRYLQQAANLQVLDFSRATKISDASVQQLQGVVSLQRLDLTGCVRLTDDALSVIGSSLRLRSLDLTGCTGLTAPGLTQLAPLAACLEVLTLCGCTAVSDFSTVEIARLTAVTFLDLSSTHISDLGLGRVLEGLGRLQAIECQGCPGLKGRALRHVGQSMRRVNIAINLDLKERSLRHLKQLPGLESLAVNFCLNIGDYACTHHISELTTLTFLDLSACVVCTDLGLQRLSTLTSLRILKMGHLPNVRGPGLACLEHMPDLEELLCPGCKNLKLNGRSLRLRALTKLRTVDFTECRRIQNDCVKELPTTIARALFQDCDRITDEALEHIAHHWTELEMLDLTSSRNVSDRGVRLLMQAFGSACLDLRTADCPLITQPKKPNPFFGAVRKIFGRGAAREGPMQRGLYPGSTSGATGRHLHHHAHAHSGQAGPSAQPASLLGLGLSGNEAGPSNVEAPRSPTRSQNAAVPSTSTLIAAQQNPQLNLVGMNLSPILEPTPSVPTQQGSVSRSSAGNLVPQASTPRNLTPRADALPAPSTTVSPGTVTVHFTERGNGAVVGGEPGPSTTRPAVATLMSALRIPQGSEDENDHEVLIIASEAPDSPRNEDGLSESLVLDENTLQSHGLAPSRKRHLFKSKSRKGSPAADHETDVGDGETIPDSLVAWDQTSTSSRALL